MPRRDSRHALAVEARHQVGHGIVGAATNGVCSGGVTAPIRHGEQDLGAFDMASRLAACTADLGEDAAFLVSEQTQGIFLATGHG